jgi:hypothetical protein
MGGQKVSGRKGGNDGRNNGRRSPHKGSGFMLLGVLAHGSASTVTCMCSVDQDRILLFDQHSEKLYKASVRTRDDHPSIRYEI